MSYRRTSDLCIVTGWQVGGEKCKPLVGGTVDGVRSKLRNSVSNGFDLRYEGQSHTLRREALIAQEGGLRRVEKFEGGFLKGMVDKCHQGCES